ncbi:hypothetical protein DCC79_14570 [bacterium]|nr:MAG: hypothetical protein DCC79_14570 [bacterium]
MAEVLDGADDGPLVPHLATCPDCAAEWRALGSLEAWLEAQSLDEPPAHLAHRVMHRLELDAAGAALEAWRRSLLQIGAILAGVTALALGGAIVFFDLPVRTHAVVLGAWVMDMARAAWRWVDASHSGAGGAALWLVYGGLAIAIAAIWFGALVVPRTALADRRSHDT